MSREYKTVIERSNKRKAGEKIRENAKNAKKEVLKKLYGQIKEERLNIQESQKKLEEAVQPLNEQEKTIKEKIRRAAPIAPKPRRPAPIAPKPRRKAPIAPKKITKKEKTLQMKKEKAIEMKIRNLESTINRHQSLILKNEAKAEAYGMKADKSRVRLNKLCHGKTHEKLEKTQEKHLINVIKLNDKNKVLHDKVENLLDKIKRLKK